MEARQKGRMDSGAVSGKGAAGGEPLVAKPPAKPRTREEEMKLFGQLMDAIRALDVYGTRKAALGGAKMDARDEEGRAPLSLVREIRNRLDDTFDEMGRRSGGGVVDFAPLGIEPIPLPEMGTLLDEMGKLRQIKAILVQHGAKE